MAERVWSEKDLVRRANRRLAVLRHAEEVSENAAATCRYFGISRNIFYRWKRRWEDEGLDGLKDRSSAPLHCPTITHPEVVEKIIHLRQHYHLGTVKDRDVPASLSRRGERSLDGLPHPQTPRDEPAARVPALQTPPEAVEALRETASGPPAADRRQVRRADHHRR